MDFKALRAKRNDKARSLIESSGGKVDSSTWTPDEMLNADVKTGMRPISRRAFKAGGKVEGENAKSNLSRSPRGFKETVGLANTNQKDANEEREGKKHVGGFKNGGRTGMMGGGLPIKQKGQSAMKGTDDYDPMYEYNPVEDPEGDKKRRIDRGQAALEEEQRRMGDMTRRKDGGRTAKASGGSDGDGYVEGKDYIWKDAENGDYKTRHFFTKAEKKARANPAPVTAAAPKKSASATPAASSTMTTSPRPPKRPAAAPAAAAPAASVRNRTKNSEGDLSVQDPMNYTPAKKTSSVNIPAAAAAAGTAALGAGILAAGLRGRPANGPRVETANVTNPNFGRGRMAPEGFQGKYQTGVSRPGGGGSGLGMIMGQDPMFNALGGGGFGALEQMNDETKRLYKRGGKADKKYEGSPKDNLMDARMAKKKGMTHAEWEDSPEDKRMDAKGQREMNMRAKKMGGGEMAAVAPVASKMVKDPKKAIAGGLLAGMKKGGAAHGDDCSCKACGGSAGYKDGGGLYANINAKRERIENGSGEKMRKVGSKGAPDAEDFKDSAKTAKKEHGGRMGRATGGRTKGTTNISINVMPHTPNKPMGIQPPMPPMPPVGGPPPMGGMPPPPPMPPRGGGGMPPGLMAAMSGAAGDGPPPPPSMGMPPPPMGRKAGGKVYPIDSGAGGAKARLDKIKAYGLKQK